MGKEKPVSYLWSSLEFWAVTAEVGDSLGAPWSVKWEKRPPPTPAKLFLLCAADEAEGEEKSGDEADKGVSNFGVFISLCGKCGNT